MWMHYPFVFSQGIQAMESLNTQTAWVSNVQAMLAAVHHSHVIMQTVNSKTDSVYVK